MYIYIRFGLRERQLAEAVRKKYINKKNYYDCDTFKNKNHLFPVDFIDFLHRLFSFHDPFGCTGCFDCDLKDPHHDQTYVAHGCRLIVTIVCRSGRLNGSTQDKA